VAGRAHPPPPDALRARIREVLGVGLGAPASEAHAACLAAGERLLASLLDRERADRADALDLLTADALVTYAIEAAADQPETLDARTTEAMRRLSGTLHPHPAS
jgi:hypothetical protein